MTAEILTDFQQVRGKAGILLRIAVAALDNPDGAVRDVIFPVADEQTFQNLVKEQRAGATYQQRIHTIIRSSCSSHYRRMLPKLLDVLEFRSNKAVYRPLIDAFEVIQREQEPGPTVFRPLGGDGGWRDWGFKSNGTVNSVKDFPRFVAVAAALRTAWGCKP